MKDMTFMFVTHRRPDCARRLIRSIGKYYPESTVMVSDTSPEPLEYDAINMPVSRDQGLASCRNLMSSMCDTDYYCMLDDDHVFTINTKIESLVEWVDNGFDLCGGLVDNSNAAWIGDFVKEGGLLKTVGRVDNRTARQVESLYSFYVAKKGMPLSYDPQFKIGGEHLDFLIRAKEAGLKLMYVPRVRIGHIKQKKGKLYARDRARGRRFRKKCLQKHGLVDHKTISL